MLFSCATALLDNQKRKSTGIQRFVFGDIFILMRTQQATPFCCRFANNRRFSLTALSQCRNCGDTIDAKRTCWFVVVSSNTEDCATRWWDHNGLTDGSCNASLLNQRCPTHGRISSYIPALKFVFFLLKQSPRHWRQMVPKKTLAFCCCALRCIWNSNELVCSKIEKEDSKSNELLQVQKVAVVATWKCDRIKKLLLLFTTVNMQVFLDLYKWYLFVFIQNVLYANLIRTLIHGLLYVLQFSATLLTQHLLNQKLTSTP